ncbi:hypothetical protein CASFOL_023526 [Castilleja foliolosa]|uniref:Gag protein n=1 Tax=Castilleja foliolosa TaxID=1961234 RepID=A0ABD3CPN6_9LAMI
MGDKSDPKTDYKGLHPAYTVSNIATKVRTLDGTKVSYSSWTKLFTLQAVAYKVLHHIDGSTPPAKTDDGYDQWKEIDALVLQWIYSTLSDDLLARVLDTDVTAQAAWDKVKSIFLSNKGSRAAALEQQFSNLTLSACSSMDDYAQKLKDLANQLTDVDHPVSESRLVLQLVRGLPAEYDVVGAFINQSSPSWDTARSMLQLETQRQSARQPAPAVLAAASDSKNTCQQAGNSSSGGNQGRGRGGQGRGRGRNNRGRGRSSPGQQQWQGYWPPGWTPPPSPYPSQPFGQTGDPYSSGQPRGFQDRLLGLLQPQT